MQTENNQTREYPLTTKLLIACGAIGPLLFIFVFLVEGATRPGYSAWHNFVSDLSLSNQGWMQIANFLTCGVLMLCFGHCSIAHNKAFTFRSSLSLTPTPVVGGRRARA